MKIEFRKISNSSKSVNLKHTKDTLDALKNDEFITFSGEIQRLDSNLVKLSGVLNGELDLVCVRSGQEFRKEIKQDLVLYFSNGIWEAQSQKRANTDIMDDIELNIIEFFEGVIDIDFALQSEIESMRLDYNIKE